MYNGQMSNKWRYVGEKIVVGGFQHKCSSKFFSSDFRDMLKMCGKSRLGGRGEGSNPPKQIMISSSEKGFVDNIKLLWDF